MESGLFFSITFPRRQLAKPVSSGFAQALSPGRGMALPSAVHAAQPILRLVHFPDRHLYLGPTVNWPLTLHLCCVPPQVSQAAADLLAYCEAHVREDPLIIPVPASENPFREKKFFCTIL